MRHPVEADVGAEALDADGPWRAAAEDLPVSSRCPHGGSRYRTPQSPPGASRCRRSREGRRGDPGVPFDGPFGRTFTFPDPDGYAVTVHDQA